jgi:hypothetical protein
MCSPIIMYILYIVNIQQARRKKKIAKKIIFSNFSNSDILSLDLQQPLRHHRWGSILTLHSSLHISFKFHYRMIRVDRRGNKLEEAALFGS